jgi:hypothetical protein
MGKLFRLIGVFLTLAAGISAGTNYYISSSGGSDSNNGTSPSSAWKSFSKLNTEWNNINPGDTILIKRGDYFAPSSIGNLAVIEFPINKSGVEGSPIVIGAYGSGELPVISGENLSGFFHLIRISGGAFLTFQDLHLKGKIYVRAVDNDFGAYHLRFLRLKFDGGFIIFYNPFQPASTPEPNSAPPIHNIEIAHSEFLYPDGPDCINLGATTGHNWIHHNKFYGVNEEAIDISGGDSNRIEYNLISGTGVNGMKIHSQFTKQKNLLIRGNLVLGSDSYSLALQNVENARVHNNTFIGNGNALFVGWLNSNPPQISNLENTALDLYNNYIENNIFVGGVIVTRAANVVYNYMNGTQGFLSQDHVWEDNYFNNNIYYYSGLGVKMRIWSYDGEVNYDPAVLPYGQYSGNLSFDEIEIEESNFNSIWAAQPNIESDLYIEPLFKNPYWNSPEDYGDFSLQPNSPALQSGKPIPDYLFDLLGNPIPQNQNPDRGAIQSSFIDVVPPSLNSVIPESMDQLLLTFSEPLDPESAEEVSNYEISLNIEVLDAVRLADGHEVRLSTTQHDLFTQYTISVVNIEDIAGNIIVPPSNIIDYSIENDFTIPNLENAFLSDTSSLILSFSEPLDAASSTLVQNYNIFPELEIYEIFTAGSNDYVMLKTENHTNGDYTVSVQNLTDLFGNVINADSNSAQYSYSDTLIQGSVSLDLKNIYVTSSSDTAFGFIKLKDGKRVFSGDPYGRWASTGYPQTILIDLEAEEEIKFMKTSFYGWNTDKLYNYSISAGSDTANLTEIYSNILSENREWTINSFNSINARYIELELLASVPGQDDTVSIWEIEILGKDNSVPVELTGFSAERIAEGVLLKWTTASETNNLGFEVQRSLTIGNANFESIGFIEGNGSSTEENSYRFTDLSVPDGDSLLYRLKQIDYDGSFEYSDNILIMNDTPGSFRLSQNYPNPFNPVTAIDYELPIDAFVNLEVFNLLGERVLIAINQDQKAGRYTINLEMKNMQSGVYFYRLTAGKSSSVKKLILVK